MTRSPGIQRIVSTSMGVSTTLVTMGLFSRILIPRAFGAPFTRREQ